MLILRRRTSLRRYGCRAFPQNTHRRQSVYIRVGASSENLSFYILNSLINVTRCLSTVNCSSSTRTAVKLPTLPLRASSSQIQFLSNFFSVVENKYSQLTNKRRCHVHCQHARLVIMSNKDVEPPLTVAYLRIATSTFIKVERRRRRVACTSRN